jgi:hypothetical protein
MNKRSVAPRVWRKATRVKVGLMGRGAYYGNADWESLWDRLAVSPSE